MSLWLGAVAALVAAALGALWLYISRSRARRLKVAQKGVQTARKAHAKAVDTVQKAEKARDDAVIHEQVVQAQVAKDLDDARRAGGFRGRFGRLRRDVARDADPEE